MFEYIKIEDNNLYQILQKEIKRQQQGLVMIPSENYASLAVLSACGTPFMNKYSEGYPKKRYYTGNQFIDELEILAIERAKKLFKAEHVNVQPHSGSSANMEAYAAVLEPGDKILAMRLDQGGHLTHGSPVNFSGKLYNVVFYGVRKDTEMIDMDEVEEIAKREKPKLIVSGTTAYPRILNFDKFFEIAKKVGAYCLADISHIAGLVIAKIHPDPVPTHDIVTTTTHKTLRGPRSAIIMCKKKDRIKGDSLAKKIDKSVFPGHQGGPLENKIAGKAVCFKEAMKQDFIEYQKQIVKNAKKLAETLMGEGLKLVSNGTDNHLMLIDVRELGITGKQGANALAEVGIYTNFNTIPYDPNPPFNPSGIRLGTPALTTRGMKEKEMEIIGKWIAKVLKNIKNESLKAKIKNEVRELTEKFPIYEEIN